MGGGIQKLLPVMLIEGKKVDADLVGQYDAVDQFGDGLASSRGGFGVSEAVDADFHGGEFES